MRDVALQAATYGDDARRRWAELRVESIALSGGGREATTDAALRAGLITPWTALLTNGGEYLPTSLGARVLDAAVGPDLGFNAVLATPRVFGGALAAPRDAASFEDADYPIQGAMDLAARRVVDDAKSALRSCRDSRAALRPELSGSVELTFKLSGEGRASDIRAQGMSDNDDPLNRCLENVIEGLTFPRSLTNDTVTVTYVASFPPPDPTLRARKCSPTSTLDLPLRRGVWRERIDRMTAPAAYLDAKRSCELPNWTAKRSMLELILSTLGGSGRPALEHAKALEDAGDAEAAAFLRKEAIRRAAPEELKALRSMLLAAERVPRTELDKQYAAAIDDKARLGVVRRFLGFAPHSTLLQRREIELLAALGDKENLVAAVRRIRLDPFADATLIAAGAHLLRKAGPELEAEARRTFFEIAERGPSDPWGRAFLGDRLRAEGWFDDATESYEVLDRLVPSDGATGIRLALAHAGAKRLDVALRVLSRIEKTGGRGADKLASLVADRLAHLLIQEALEAKELAPETRSSLSAREADFPALSSSPTIVIRTDGGSSPLTVVVERGPEKAREVIEPDAILASLGVYTVALPAGDTSNVTLTLSQPKGVRPEAPVTARVGVLRAGGGVVGGSFDMKLSGDGTRVGWDGHALAVLGDKAAK